MSIPRGEYPRPQCVRDQWLCLNGEWQFEIDSGDSGLERGLRERALKDRITVPFCPESELSGIGCTDFMNAVWYRREVEIPADWVGQNVLLHFQAVDYDATVWVNGCEVMRHRGGFSPFTCDLAGVVQPGQNAVIVVRARDDHRSSIPKGKQCPGYDNHGCLYTRTTGIWQTVWLEPVPALYLQRPRITPDTANARFILEQPIRRVAAPGAEQPKTVRATLRSGDQAIGFVEADVNLDLTPILTLYIPEDKVVFWQPGQAHLYDLDIALLNAAGAVMDQVRSYAGLRSINIEGRAVTINGKRVFQRQVLDQGYYPDGILTAPSDEALKRDIVLSLEAGFNAARLHQKVFEERFLYHADQLGYLIWGEFGDWHNAAEERDGGWVNNGTYITQWLEVLERDFSHPSIIGWCPLNETHEALGDRIKLHDDLMRGMFLATKAMDPTRPVLDTSGYCHRVRDADIYDSHDYTQSPEELRQRHAGLAKGKPYVVERKNRTESIPYNNQPYFVSEFGGIWWNPDAGEDEYSWGYGDRPRNLEEFYTRFEGLCLVLLENPHMFGYCYTQLTDVFQEQNGIYRFNRETKFDMERIRGIQQAVAAIEQ